MSNMLMHCGASYVPYKDLTEMAALMPQQTETHVPIAHHAIIDQAKILCTDHGWFPEEEKFAISHEGQRMFGVLEIAEKESRPDYRTVLGLRNSHDKTFPVGISVGSRVFVCDNLSFSGDVVIKTRHTKYVQDRIYNLMEKAFHKLKYKKEFMEYRIDQYKKHEPTLEEASHIMVKAVREGALPGSKITKVIKDWDSMEEMEKFGGRSTWGLFNSFTNTLTRDYAPQTNWTKSQKLHMVFDRHLNIAPVDAICSSEVDEDSVIQVFS